MNKASVSTFNDSFAAKNVAWVADMIAPDTDLGVGQRQPYVCKKFDVSVEEKTYLKISALGLYSVFINGRKLESAILSPGFTCYSEQNFFQIYQIDSLLQLGKNRIEIWLGDGWYRSQIMWDDFAIENAWGSRVACIAQIETINRVVEKTDATWLSGLTPITASGIYLGEVYDARLEGEADIMGVSLIDFDKNNLQIQQHDPIKELETLYPVSYWDNDINVYTFDFGQNCSGYISVKLKGKKGSVAEFRHSEIIGKDNRIDNRNYRTAKSTIRYTLSGNEAEVYKPTFTFMGCRFVEANISGSVKIESISFIPISSITNLATQFNFGHDAVNQLINNTIWSMRSNFIDVPLDCPQRDERLGWSGDAQVFAPTACWLADCERFYIKYLSELMHDQRDSGAISHFSPDPTRINQSYYDGIWAGSTGWGDAITVIPWTLFVHYNNRDILQDCFESMTRWSDYVWSISKNGIVRPKPIWGDMSFTFGDWLQPTSRHAKPLPTINEECVATIYSYISNTIISKCAKVLGKDVEAEKYRARSELIKQSFEDEFFSKNGRIGSSDQTTYALCFLHDMVPEKYYQNAKENFLNSLMFTDFNISTGFIGTPILLPALTKVGLLKEVEKIFFNDVSPGWLYQIKHGATTIWENWDAIKPDGSINNPEMNSYNHYSYGAVCQWLFETVVGISPVEEDPGFKSILVKPNFFRSIQSLGFSHESKFGSIKVNFKIIDNSVFYEISTSINSKIAIFKKDYEFFILSKFDVIYESEDNFVIKGGDHKIEYKI